MANTGNILAGTGENNAGIGATAWTLPGNVTADDAADATCAAAASSQYLVARNFALSGVPVNATVNGIVVRVEASEHSAATEALLSQLQNASGTLFGSSKASAIEGNISGTAKAVYNYGTTSDVWGATITPAILHDADFGVRFWFTTAHDVRVDFVTLAVEYTNATFGISSVANEALALTRQKQIATGVSSVVNESLALTWQAGDITIPTGLSTESESALAVSIQKQVATGLGSVVNAALALTFQKQRTTSVSESTDTALALSWDSAAINQNSIMFGFLPL